MSMGETCLARVAAGHHASQAGNGPCARVRAGSATRERIYQDRNDERVRAKAAEARCSMCAFLAEGERHPKKAA